jgi:hypothetical protein
MINTQSEPVNGEIVDKIQLPLVVYNDVALYTADLVNRAVYHRACDPLATAMMDPTGWLQKGPRQSSILVSPFWHCR